MHRTEGENNVNNLFSDGPPATILDASWANSIQEEIANVIERSGLNLKNAGTDTRDQLWIALQRLVTPYDVIIGSQEEFNDLWVRTSANNYDIKSDYRSVYIKFISGGYDMTGVLSGGDSYAIFHTNICNNVFFEVGAKIDIGDSLSYWYIDIDDCICENVWLDGDGSVAVAATKSFYIDAYRAKLVKCKTTNRNTNTTFYAFENVNTDAKARTCEFHGCIVDDITSSGATLIGYNYCQNLIRCIAKGMTSSGATTLIGFSDCESLSNCLSDDLQCSGTAEVSGYKNSEKLIGCAALNIDTATLGGTGSIFCFNGCNFLSSCQTKDCDATNVIRAFSNCDGISGCYALRITTTSSTVTGFHTCDSIVGCYVEDLDAPAAGSTCSGFLSCNAIVGCYAKDIDSASNAATVSGFNGCRALSGCYVNGVDQTDAGGINAYGFTGCTYMSGCWATNITSTAGTAHGFENCDYGSAIGTDEATNGNNDWMDTVDAQITNKVSTPSIWT